MANNTTDKEEELKTLFSQLSKLDAAIFYLEHVIESLDTKIDKNDVDVSIKILKKLRNEKQTRLTELTSKN